MTEKLNLSDVHIPVDMLHDHKLISFDYDGDKIILSFDFHWMSDYVETEYTSKFRGFTKCDMIIELNEISFGDFTLEGCVKANNKYTGLLLGIDGFSEVLNNCTEATFLYAYTNGYTLIIEFAVSFYNCKKHFRKFKNYGIAKMELFAKSITCNWQ